MKDEPIFKERVKRISLIVVSVLLIFSIISMVIVKVIYDSQFPRYDRPDETVMASLRYKDFERDYPRQLVGFKSGENSLQGYVYGVDQPLGMVVVAHGLGGGADSYLAQIMYFIDQGWAVFSYDATGSYDSEGKNTKGFPQALRDLDAALTYINNEPEYQELPMMLFGHSWGGYAVANAPHFNHDIAGIVSVSGVNSPMGMIMEQGQRMLGGFIYTQYPYLWLYQRLLFGKVSTMTAVDAINQSNVPVMLIHGTEDDLVFYDGCSIIAQKEAITNPNVKELIIDEPGRNGHNDIFRSNAAIAYIDQVNAEYREIYDLYEQNIPYDKNQDFYVKIDRNLAQELHQELMDDIHDFFLSCIDE